MPKGRQGVDGRGLIFARFSFLGQSTSFSVWGWPDREDRVRYFEHITVQYAGVWRRLYAIKNCTGRFLLYNCHDFFETHRAIQNMSYSAILAAWYTVLFSTVLRCTVQDCTVGQSPPVTSDCSF